MQTPHQDRHDVVIVGARAAGAAAAYCWPGSATTWSWWTGPMPSDTISTHQIARTGVVALRRWGLLDAVIASGAPAIRQVTFTAGSSTAGAASAADETITRQ